MAAAEQAANEAQQGCPIQPRNNSVIMAGYFKPPRRKIGVATLAMACVLTSMWIRSLMTEDFIFYGCISRNGALEQVELVLSKDRVHTGEAIVTRLPYWSIVIPLTLLSAYLLLSKPRKSNQKKTPASIATVGT